jgi:hypothetical protein
MRLTKEMYDAAKRRGWRFAPAGLYETVHDNQKFTHPHVEGVMVLRNHLNKKKTHDDLALLMPQLVTWY